MQIGSIITARELKNYINSLSEEDLNREVWRDNDGVSAPCTSIKLESNIRDFDDDNHHLPTEQRKIRHINILFLE